MSSQPFPQALQACSSLQERFECLENLLAEMAGPHLHLDSGAAVPRDRALIELGLTSLGATEFQRQLEKRLAIKLDSSTVFNHPTILALRDYLAAEKLREAFARPVEAVRVQAAGVKADAVASADGKADDVEADDVEADYVQALLSRRFGI